MSHGEPDVAKELASLVQFDNKFLTKELSGLKGWFSEERLQAFSELFQTSSAPSAPLEEEKTDSR